jgi:uncharacterized membrane protein (UPF0127 family)
MKLVKIIKKSDPQKFINVKICRSFKDQLLGLMFTKNINDDFGILLIQNRETRMDAAIHMFFMNYDICVLWLDREFRVVDKTIAQKWRPAYVPKKSAQYVLETHTSQSANFQIGDQLEYQND